MAPDPAESPQIALHAWQFRILFPRNRLLSSAPHLGQQFARGLRVLAIFDGFEHGKIIHIRLDELHGGRARNPD